MGDSQYPRIAGINYESTVDGVGVRTVIFFSGCSHHCPGCQNADIQDENAGVECTDETIKEIAKGIVSRPFVKGITLSGGDPLYDPYKTTDFLVALSDELVKLNGDLVGGIPYDVWLYTGYTWEQMCRRVSSVLMSLVDVVVDGRFIQEQADKRLRFRGSRNQRIIDVQASVRSNNVILWTKRRK